MHRQDILRLAVTAQCDPRSVTKYLNPDTRADVRATLAARILTAIEQLHMTGAVPQKTPESSGRVSAKPAKE